MTAFVINQPEGFFNLKCLLGHKPNKKRVVIYPRNYMGIIDNDIRCERCRKHLGIALIEFEQ